jgi:predicted RNA-binding Zn-ribbon protein involved in translation (DUF1610 family)
MPDARWDAPDDDALCPYCGEDACERSCTAALAAAVGECATCGYAILAEDGATCPACGEAWRETAEEGA